MIKQILYANFLKFRLYEFIEVFKNKKACKLEWRVKRLKRKDKERLVAGVLGLDGLLEEVN